MLRNINGIDLLILYRMFADGEARLPHEIQSIEILT